MPHAIYKYELELTSRQMLALPVDAEILCIQAQHGTLQLWAIVDTSPTAEVESRTFEICGTGQQLTELTDEYRFHLGTVQMTNGNLVWHIFEVHTDND